MLRRARLSSLFINLCCPAGHRVSLVGFSLGGVSAIRAAIRGESWIRIVQHSWVHDFELDLDLHWGDQENVEISVSLHNGPNFGLITGR